MYMCVYMYVCIYVYMYTCVYMYIYMYVCIYVYICMYVYYYYMYIRLIIICTYDSVTYGYEQLNALIHVK